MIAITLDKQSYAPGEEIIAKVKVGLAKPTRVRGIFAKLVCIEKKKVKSSVVLDKYDFERDREMSQPYSSHMETRTDIREGNWFAKEEKIGAAGELSEGDFEAKFFLPLNAPPTSYEYGHDNAIYIWKLRVKADIPLAIDDNAEAEVFVKGL